MSITTDPVWERDLSRSESSPFAIQTRRLTKIFGHRMAAVNNLNVDVPSGAIYGFLGPNGAGKTTTIKMLLGMVHPSAGESFIFGQRMDPDAKALRMRVGYLPTNPRFPPNMTPLKYLDFVGRLFQIPKEKRVPRLTALLRAVDMLESGGAPIKTFSTGMTTRLGIASALINDPDLLILDEPTAGLDPVGRASTIKLIRELGKEKTVFVSSHILGEIDKVCTHVGIISDGKLIFSGDVTEAKRMLHRGMVTIEVDEHDDELEGKVKGVEGVENVSVTRNAIQFSIVGDASIGGVIRRILEHVEGSGGEAISVNTSGGELEDAFLNLIEKEESSGFLRAFE